MNTAPLKTRKKGHDELLYVLREIASDEDLFGAFLVDLLTPTERDDLAARWQIVKLLASNTPQRDIAQQLNVSIATVTRGSRALHDSKGGFSRVLGWRNKKTLEG